MVVLIDADFLEDQGVVQLDEATSEVRLAHLVQFRLNAIKFVPTLGNNFFQIGEFATLRLNPFVDSAGPG